MGCGATHGRLPVGDFTPRVDHAVLPVRHAERVVGGAAGVAAWWVLFDVVHRRVFAPYFYRDGLVPTTKDNTLDVTRVKVVDGDRGAGGGDQCML